MLNKAPIIINGFARGGTNIITNLVLSHPDVCLSNGETHSIFKGTKWDSRWRFIQKRIFYDTPIRLLTGEDFFSPHYYSKRKSVPNYIKRYIDWILYNGRYAAIIDSHNRFKTENTEYTKDELSRCRLLTKGLNGLVFTREIYSEMYPDGVFLGLVRNGLAVCEGFVRRGADARDVGKIYSIVARQLIENATEKQNCHLFYYENMVASPLEFMRKLYDVTDLDIGQVDKVRLQSKSVMQANGRRVRIKGNDRQVFWHSKDEISAFIKKDVNENQIKQLSNQDRDKFLSVAYDVMQELGYPC